MSPGIGVQPCCCGGCIVKEETFPGDEFPEDWTEVSGTWTVEDAEFSTSGTGEVRWDDVFAGLESWCIEFDLEATGNFELFVQFPSDYATDAFKRFVNTANGAYRVCVISDPSARQLIDLDGQYRSNIFSSINGTEAGTGSGIYPSDSNDIEHTFDGHVRFRVTGNAGEVTFSNLRVYKIDEFDCMTNDPAECTEAAPCLTSTGGNFTALAGSWTAGSGDDEWIATGEPTRVNIGGGRNVFEFSASDGDVVQLRDTNDRWKIEMTVGSSPSVKLYTESPSLGGYTVRRSSCAHSLEADTFHTVAVNYTSNEIGMVLNCEPFAYDFYPSSGGTSAYLETTVNSSSITFRNFSKWNADREDACSFNPERPWPIKFGRDLVGQQIKLTLSGAGSLSGEYILDRFDAKSDCPDSGDLLLPSGFSFDPVFNSSGETFRECYYVDIDTTISDHVAKTLFVRVGMHGGGSYAHMAAMLTAEKTTGSPTYDERLVAGWIFELSSDDEGQFDYGDRFCDDTIALNGGYNANGQEFTPIDFDGSSATVELVT